MTSYRIDSDVDIHGHLIKNVCPVCEREFSARGLRTHHAMTHGHVTQ